MIKIIYKEKNRNRLKKRGVIGREDGEGRNCRKGEKSRKERDNERKERMIKEIWNERKEGYRERILDVII